MIDKMIDCGCGLIDPFANLADDDAVHYANRNSKAIRGRQQQQQQQQQQQDNQYSLRNLQMFQSELQCERDSLLHQLLEAKRTIKELTEERRTGQSEIQKLKAERQAHRSEIQKLKHILDGESNEEERDVLDRVFEW